MSCPAYSPALLNLDRSESQPQVKGLLSTAEVCCLGRQQVGVFKHSCFSTPMYPSIMGPRSINSHELHVSRPSPIVLVAEFGFLRLILRIRHDRSDFSSTISFLGQARGFLIGFLFGVSGRPFWSSKIPSPS